MLLSGSRRATWLQELAFRAISPRYADPFSPP